jgi:hypothetical protein
MTHQLISIARKGRDIKGTTKNAEDPLRDPLRDRLRDRLRDPLSSAGTPYLCCSHAVFRRCSLCDISMSAGVLL